MVQVRLFCILDITYSSRLECLAHCHRQLQTCTPFLERQTENRLHQPSRSRLTSQRQSIILSYKQNIFHRQNLFNQSKRWHQKKMANNNDQLMQYNLFIQNFTNSIPLKQLIMYQKISNNYQSIPLGREKESFILKRIKKPKRFALNVKDAEQNPIYRVMKNQREITPILNAILNNPELGLKNSQKEQHSHSRLLDVHQLSTVEIYNKSESNKQMETFKQKAVRIMAGTRMMTEQLEKSKRKINILDKFNKKVEKYCSYLPQTPDQQRNQSQNANDQLIKLCRHNFFPTQDLHKRAHSLLHYREPHISTSKIKRLKERTKTSSLNRPSQASPMKRFLTLNI